jgi:hypothetical protein
MAGERVVPGLGWIKAFYTPGTSGWEDGVDLNLLGLSAVCQLAVESRTDALPGSPTDGVIYIVPSGGDVDKVAVRDNGGWVYFTPKPGWLAWVKDDEEFVYYNNASDWVVLTTGGGGATTLDALTDVDVAGAANNDFLKLVGGVWVGAVPPTASIPPWGVSTKVANYTLVLGDASSTIAMNKATTGTVTFPPNAVVAFPVGTEIELYQMGAGQLVPTPGSGVTLNALGGVLSSPGQFGRGTARQTATDVWSIEWSASTGSGGVVASVAEFLNGTPDKLIETDTLWDAAEPVALTDAATIAADYGTFINAFVTLAGNRTLGAPSNAKPGQSGVIEVSQDATGGRTLAYAAGYVTAGGLSTLVLSTAASAKDKLAYQVLENGNVMLSLIKDVKA